MSDDLKIVTVPRELYYHEIAYVRGLEADNERLRDALKAIECRSIDHTDACRMAGKARAALEQKP